MKHQERKPHVGCPAEWDDDKFDAITMQERAL